MYAEKVSVSKPRKRNRPTIVCNHCRSRKTKCDKKVPCSHCERLGLVSTCSYSSVPRQTAKGRKAASPAGLGDHGHAPPVPMHPNATVALSPRGDNMPFRDGMPPPSLLTLHRLYPVVFEHTIAPGLPLYASQPAIRNDPVVQHELSALKTRLKELEASITVASLQQSGSGVPLAPITANSVIKAVTAPSSHQAIRYLHSPASLIHDWVGINPHMTHGDTINFYQDLCTRGISITTRKPIPMFTLARLDPSILLFMRAKQGPRVSGMGRSETKDDRTELIASTIDAPVANLEQLRNLQFKATLKELVSNAESSQEIINPMGRIIGVTSTPIIENATLEEQILHILPDRVVLWKLVDRFFALVYPFFPIVDELAFRPELERLMDDGDLSTERIITALATTRKQDYVFMGMCLIMLRLSYLSLFRHSIAANESIINAPDAVDTLQEQQDVKFLLLHPIPVESIAVAKGCLKQVDMFRRVSLGTFQCMLFLKSYTAHAPEEGEGNVWGDTQMFTGLLISAAYSLNLNRDPDYYDHNYVPSRGPVALDAQAERRLNNLRRKMWHFLVAQDIRDCVLLGNSISLRQHEYDTKLPVHQGDANIFDLNLELEVMSSFAIFERLRQPFLDVINVLLNTRDRAPMSDVAQKMTHLERSLRLELGNLEEYLNPSYSASGFLKTLRLKFLFMGYLLMLLVQYALYLHYLNVAKQSNDAEAGLLLTFYFKKLLVLSFLKLQPSLPELLDESHGYLDKVAPLILLPLILSMNNYVILVGFIACARFLSRIKMLEFSADHHSTMSKDSSYKLQLETLKRIIESLKLSRRSTGWVTDLLSNRYYLAWKARKSHIFAHKLLDSDDLYTHDIETTRKAALSFRQDELNDVLTICESGEEKVNAFPKFNLAPAEQNTPLDESMSDMFWLHVYALIHEPNEEYDTNPHDESVSGDNVKSRSYKRGSSDIHGAHLLHSDDDSQSSNNPFTPQFGFPMEALQYDFGIFNGQSLDDYFAASLKGTEV